MPMAAADGAVYYGDTMTGRTVHVRRCLTFYFVSNQTDAMGRAEQEIKAARWLWVDVRWDSRRGENRFRLFTHQLCLTCVHIDSPLHSNSYFKVIGVSDKSASDRLHSVKYGVRLYLHRGITPVSGELYHLPKTRDSVEIAARIEELSNEIRNLNHEALDERRNNSETTLQKRRAWGDTLKEIVAFQDDYERQTASTVCFKYVRYTPVPSQRGVGVVYRFFLEEDTLIGDKLLRKEVIASKEPILVHEDLKIHGMVVDASASPPSLIIAFQSVVDFGKIPDKGYLSVSETNIAYWIQARAIDDLVEGRSVNQTLLDTLIDGEFRPVVRSHDVKVEGLREAQLRAINLALDAEDLALIQGPPGTGKTSIIVEMLKKFAGEGKRVLVSSKNNLAVDNVLEKCIEVGIPCIRLGREESVKVDIVKGRLIDYAALSMQKDIIQNCDQEEIAALENLRHQTMFVQKLHELTPELQLYVDQRTRIGLLDEQRSKRERRVKQKSFYLILPLIVSKIYSVVSQKNELFKEGKERYKKKIEERLKQDGIYGGLTNLLNRFVNENSIQKVTLDAKLEPAYKAFPYASMIRAELAAALASEDRYLQHLDSQNLIIKEWKDALEQRQQSLYPLLLNSVKVIGATAIGVNTSSDFKDVDFDVTIIDEAGQITIFDALVPMSRAKKVVLIGDHKQLPPVANENMIQLMSEEWEDKDGESPSGDPPPDYEKLLGQSLFETLFYSCPDDNKVMLNEQFRMHPAIAEFVSRQFYESGYKSGLKDEDRVLRNVSFTSPLYFIDTRQEGQTRYESVDADDDHLVYFNILEAQIISHIVRALIDQGVMPQDIGVITPYRRQKAEIERVLKDLAAAPLNHLEIDTVDSFQGRDKKVIIFGFTRSNEEHKIGFLRDLRRLNVTMTRAKCLLIMVGDSDTLANANVRAAQRCFTNMLDYIKKAGVHQYWSEFKQNLLEVEAK